uniref:EF-hand domain-containing protein n=1 Tax=Paenirhodobacter enshiensis TaxID=1105367 RepID=UPI0035B3249C
MTNEFKTTVLALLVAGAAAVTALPAMAQDAPGPDGRDGPEMPFARGAGMAGLLKQFDANGDGKVTLAEIQSGRKAQAQSIDANGDGKISADELVNAQIARMRPMLEARAKARIAAQDTDGDGLLSAAELALPPMPERLMDKFGPKGDGAIDLSDLRGPMMGAMMGDRDWGERDWGERGHGRGDRGPGMMGGNGPDGDCGMRPMAGPMGGPGPQGKPAQN